MTTAAGGGTGSSLARAIIIVTGVSALVSSLLSFVSVYPIFFDLTHGRARCKLPG